MSTNIETWAKDFAFSDDLKALEALYHQQHQEQLARQLAEPAQAETASAAQPEAAVSQQPQQQEELPPPSEDERFLNQLAEKIARGLSSYLANPQVLAPYLELHDLEQDNMLMAGQMDILLNEIQAKDDEIAALKAERNRFVPVFGRFYYQQPAQH